MLQISREENANGISSISWEEKYLMNSVLNNRKDLFVPNFLRHSSLSQFRKIQTAHEIYKGDDDPPNYLQRYRNVPRWSCSWGCRIFTGVERLACARGCKREHPCTFKLKIETPQLQRQGCQQVDNFITCYTRGFTMAPLYSREFRLSTSKLFSLYYSPSKLKYDGILLTVC